MDASVKEAVAAELGEPVSKLTAERELASIGSWDSVMALTIMLLLGDLLGVPIEPNEMAACKKFGDLEALARSKKR